MKQKAIVVHHMSDVDGTCSALVSKRFLESQGMEVVLFGFNYGDKIPDLSGYDRIYLVDISFPSPDMMGLPETTTWIDHHITAINDSLQYGYSNLPGLRELRKGACELCWRYFYGDSVPRFVQLCSTYDVFDKERMDWNNDVLPLQSGIRGYYDGILPDRIYPDFEPLIKPESPLLDKLLEMGRLLVRYDARRFKSACKAYSFEIEVAGKFKGIACITTDFGSRLFDSVKQNYSIYVCSNRKTLEDGTTKYTCSMYSDPKFTGMNLGEYMKENYSGGGHPTAAGGVLSEEQFLRLILEKKI